MKKIILSMPDQGERATIAKTIEELGFFCIQCTTGIRTLLVLEDNPEVDLLLLDVDLLELRGEELIQILRGREDHKDLPIIMLSELSGYDGIAHYLDLGASRFLTKPVEYNELRDCLMDNTMSQEFAVSDSI
ncbi:Response regulator [Sulfidibacter corallicola]|uniref:Response regulator n=1 Tax=Sulfidibacter corallicola TaxID=2818388 RepID=A0A8A4TP96_SULCO|nr:response regulator [Sulfidibacter corallicola]QTD51373.1 response regulator [Sulfidibacter corallicola]